MIQIYDEDFRFVGLIDEFESIIWTRRYHKNGTFEFTLNLNTHGVRWLRKGRIVSIGDGLFGIVEFIEGATSEKGKGSDIVTIKGMDLKGLLKKRITIPPSGQAYDSVNTDAESALKHYVNVNAVNTSSKRIIPNLSIAANSRRGPTIEHQSRYKPLVDELEQISLLTGVGWDIVFTGDGYEFEVIEGRDLSIDQTENPRVTFGAEYDNVREQMYLESSLDSHNVAIVAGQGEGADRAVVTVGDASGLDRNEMFVDARDVENESLLPKRGADRLSEYKEVESFETAILTYGPFEYGEDWDLGDIVSIHNPIKGNISKQRITEVIITHEKGQPFDLSATFGEPLPTVTDIIKRELKR